MLDRYPQFNGSRNNSFNLFGTTRAGVATLNLRGLGSNRNLILLDNRRLGPSTATGEVDINILPPGLVERIEILTGGAAAAYGPDAMSGVVNFSLRKDVEGLELDSRLERTDRNDGGAGSISLLGGKELPAGRGHITGFFSHLGLQAIKKSEREISSRVLCEDTTEGEIIECGSVHIPGGFQPLPAFLDEGLAGQGTTFDASGNPIAFSWPEDAFNFNTAQSLRPRLRRTAVGGFMDMQLTPATELEAALLWSDYEVEQSFAPSTVNLEPLIVNLSNPVLSPAAVEVLRTNFDRNNIGFAVFPYYYRAMALGNRKQKSRRDNTWLNLSLKGSWLENWHWTAGYTRTEFQANTRQSGGHSTARLQQALLVDPVSGSCFDVSDNCSAADIFGPGGLSAEAAEFIREPAFSSHEDTRQQVLSLLANGNIALNDKLEIALAVGLEWREDKLGYQPDSRLTDPIDDGFGSYIPVSGRDRVTEAYAELLLPIARDRTGTALLELDLGARHSSYSNADDEWTWKTGLSLTPVAGLRFRGMYERAARAPNMEEHYLPASENIQAILGTFFIDYCAASQRPQDFPNYSERCIAQGIAPENLAVYEPGALSLVTHVTSGNRDLANETADTYTLGLVWKPLIAGNVSLTFDAYRIDISDPITYVNPLAAFNLCFISENPDKFCPGIERSPAGDLTRIAGSYFNIGAINTRGYDLGLTFRLPHTAPWGWHSGFALSLVANRVESYEILGANSGRWECAGRFGSPCIVGHDGPLPEHSALTRLQYQTGPIAATLSWQWIDGTTNASSLLESSVSAPGVDAVPSLESENYLDFAFSWQWRDSATLGFSVLNLTDTAPPQLGRFSTEANTDPSTYDVLGRRYNLTIQLRL